MVTYVPETKASHKGETKHFKGKVNRSYGVIPKGFSLVVFTKKSQKLLPELWCIASREKAQREKKIFLPKNTESST